MKNFIQAIVLVVMPAFCFAQLSGTVTDAATKEKIQGAMITIENSFLTAVSDAQGKFSFANVKPEEVKIAVTHIGFENYTRAFTLPNEKVEVLLQPKTYLSEEALVTATRASDKSPTAYTNMDKKTIEKGNLGKDIPFLLANTPSVVVTSDAGAGVGYTGIRIRGSDATRVNVTVNGIPVNDAESHQVYWVDLPDIASSTDNIQIQRGVGTSTNGAGAFGGSVNIQTSTLSQEPFATINSSYGSFNTWKNTVNFGTGLMKNKFSFDGRLSKITSDGYIDRATSDLKSFYLSGGYYGNKGSLRAIIFSGKEKTYQAWYGVPEDSLKTNPTYNPAGEYYDDNGAVHYYDNQTDNYQQDYYQLHYSYVANSKLNLNAALHYTKGKGYYEEYGSEESLANYNLNNVIVNTDTITTTDLIRQKWLDNDFYGFTYSANYESDKLQLTFGGAGNKYEGQHYDQVTWAQYFSNGSYPHIYNDNDATKSDFNTYLKAVYSVMPSLHLYGDLQYRTVSYSFWGYVTLLESGQQQTSLNFFNPKAGLTYDLNENSKVYASVAIGHKEPTRDDYVYAAPGSYPKPEEMTDVEAGYKFSLNKIRFATNIYFMNYKDQLILTGKINDVGAYIRENVNDSYRAGVEVEMAWNVRKNLTVSANVALSENKIKTFFEYLDNYDSTAQRVNEYSNPDIAFSPSVVASSDISYSPFKNLTLDLISRYVGKQYLDNTKNENRKLDAYFVNDFLLNYDIHVSFCKELRLKLGVYNFLEEKYESNGYTYSYIYGQNLTTENFYFPQAGLNWMGGISMKF